MSYSFLCACAHAQAQEALIGELANGVVYFAGRMAATVGLHISQGQTGASGVRRVNRSGATVIQGGVLRGGDGGHGESVSRGGVGRGAWGRGGVGWCKHGQEAWHHTQHAFRPPRWA